MDIEKLNEVKVEKEYKKTFLVCVLCVLDILSSRTKRVKDNMCMMILITYNLLSMHTNIHQVVIFALYNFQSFSKI